MRKIVSASKRFALAAVVFVQIVSSTGFGFGQVVMASETPTSTTPEASVTYAPCPQGTGTSSPTGAAAATYVFNPALCKWENAYYSWDPVTKITSPKYDQTPLLNAAGTAWEYTEWYYSPNAGAYKSRVISIPVPQPAPIGPSGQGQPTQNLGQSGNLPGGNDSSYGGSHTLSNTGPSSSNSLNGANTNNLNYDYNNSTAIFTDLNSVANSGNALVMGNTYGGNATSGNAEALANYLNMIQSAWNPSMGPISTFNASLQGSHNGDILFNPDAVISTTGPSSLNSVSNATDNNININAVENSSIQNDINLGAYSGDATVSQNTNGGDATTGDATAVANIINMINSSINSGGSFIGNLNIYGDLNGDLLLPASVLAQLRNTGPYSANSIDNSRSTDINIDVDKNNTIINNVELAAASGNALVDSNTNAGSATSGSATTSLKQADIVGASANGTKGLLVFVNVLGKWTGMLWDGNGLSSIGTTGPHSTNTIDNTTDTDINASLTQNNTIINNLNLEAQTGDASVVANTNAGSARSGDASASANILNLIDSDVNFSDWFGVLFINVFGTWAGSFGVNTEAGNTPKPTVTTGAGSSTGSSANTPGSTGAASSPAKTTTSSVARLTGYVAGLGSGTPGQQSSEDKSATTATSSTSTTNSNAQTPAVVAKVSDPVSGGMAGSTILWATIIACAICGLAAANRTALIGALGIRK